MNRSVIDDLACLSTFGRPGTMLGGRMLWRLSCAVALLLMLGASIAAAQCAAPACPPANCFVDDASGVDAPGCCTSTPPCKTIQAAVNQASDGDVIEVAPGTYPEPTGAGLLGALLINKSVTLCGAQDGVDARGRAASETTIANPHGTIVSADNVVVNGFTIEGNVDTITVYGLDMAQGTFGTQVLNNIIQDNIAGIGLANTGGPGGSSQVVICQNLLQNNNQPGSASGTGIYTDEYVCGSVGGTRPCTNFLIEQNAFTGNTSSGIDLSNTDLSTPITSFDISTNSFDMNGRAILLFNVDDSTFHNNNVTNSTLALSGAIRIFGGTDNFSITNNNLDTGAGWAIRMSNVDGMGPSSNVVIHQNNIANFAGDGVGPNPGGLLVGAGAHTGPVDAGCNWWDHPCGPYNVANNPLGPGEEVREEGSAGDAHFMPWLVALGPAPASGTGTCDGTVCAESTTTTTTTTTSSTTTTTVCNKTEDAETHCSNMLDDDCDNKVDCVDEDCNRITPCRPARKDPTQIRFDRTGGFDRIRGHATLDTAPVDIMARTVGALLSRDPLLVPGVVWSRALPPGALTASTSGRIFKYRDPYARQSGGFYSLKIKQRTDGTAYSFSFTAYADLSAATVSDMRLQFYLGDDVFITSTLPWTQTSNGWRAPKDH